MIQSLSVNQVSLGMFIHALDAPWLSHPFWQTHFLLTAPGDLQTLRTCGVERVWVDFSRSVGHAPPVAAAAADAPSAGPGAPESSAAPGASPTLPAAPPPVAPESAGAESPTDLATEIERAMPLLRRARRVMTTVFRQARLERAVEAATCLPVVDEIAASLARNASAFPSLARLKGRDDYLVMHALATCALMIGGARQLRLPAPAVREAGLAGLLLDLGKARTPLDILGKPGRLTDAEWEVMRQHPLRSERLLAPDMPAVVADVCLHHHEKLDGSGYPHRLAGEQISPMARLAAVCDVFDALSSRRAYKPAMDPAQALQWMATWEGHFDAGMLRALVGGVGVYPTGSLVRLRSGRLAVVLEQSARHLGQPIVKVFFSAQAQMPVPVHVLDLSDPSSGDALAAREPLARWGFTQLEELWHPFGGRRR
jgi:HD-GYP domain-containing protein (c-di-GMP phosphodiesterase class II)